MVRPIQPPDLYGVTVEGERCHRPEIYTQEELLNQAVREVRPASFSALTKGTRVTANWSPKLRGLFPGTVTEGAAPVPGMLYVEFDDGDSGYMRLEGIRLLPRDYPTVEHDQDPLDTITRRRRRTSSGTSVTSSQRAASRLGIVDDRPDIPHLPRRVDESIQRREGGQCVDESKSWWKGECVRQLVDEPKPCPKSIVKQNGEARQRRKNDGAEKPSKNCKQKQSKTLKQPKNGQPKQNGAGEAANLKHVRTGESKKKRVGAPKQNGTEKPKHKSDSAKPAKVSAQKVKTKERKNCQSEPQQERKKKKKTGEGRQTNGEDRKNGDAREEKRAEKKKKAAKRRASAGDGYVVEQESDLKIRIKSPSPTRKPDDAASPRKPSGETKKKKKAEPRQRHPSEIAPFLPERQLWDWSGKGVKRPASKGKAKREVFRGIARGLEEISVGDCAVFLSAGLPDRPYVGRIHALWEATSGRKLVQVAWFYHPEETCGLDKPLNEPNGALFESPHMDENDVQTISHRCSVVTMVEYRTRSLAAGDNETFYRAGFYDPRTQRITFEPEVVG